MIFFIHIPKTAGTTFYQIVQNNYQGFVKPKIESLSVCSLENKIQNFSEVSIRLPGGYQDAPETLNVIKNCNTETHEKIQFIGGHVGFGMYDLTNLKVNYISFVRNPKDRIISDYFEHCKKGRHYYKLLEANNFDINFYLESLLNDKLDNIMTRQIAGPFDFFMNSREKINEKQYNKALENAKRISFYDIMHFDDAILHLASKYKWSKLRYTKKNVTTKNKSKLQINESLLSEVIAYDLKLYEEIAIINNDKLSYLKKSILKIKSNF